MEESISQPPATASEGLTLSAFDYELPPERIATRPASPRDTARMLVVPPASSGQRLDHRRIADLPELLPPRSLLVVNDTRVLPARLWARKPTGGEVELVLLEPAPPPTPPGDAPGGAAGTEQPDAPGALVSRWRCLARSSKPLRPGLRLTLERRPSPASQEPAASPRCHSAQVDAVLDDGAVELTFDGDVISHAQEVGELPLPPYMRRAADPSDRDSYQTMFARHTGAVAAPTAGLHFTPALLERLTAAGHELAAVTLHVGLGTFAPVRVERVDHIRLHAERFAITEATSQAIQRARHGGRAVIAVGTTVVRTLEAAARHRSPHGPLVPSGQGRTDLCITPGLPFQVVDGLLTNFHLPRSTLLMLVAALGGRSTLLAAYREAVAEGYRFYSYGDAMLVLTQASARQGATGR
jgi:S-adenosylmethionine:tRNA ribosyltransferase-isomerase